MQILVNGTARVVEPGKTIGALARELDLAVEHLAIEHNGQIVERERFEQTVLQPEDQLEIVRFVGGG